MTRRLILLRHGQTAFNQQSRMQGQLDTPLSDTGIAQAHAVAPLLADSPIPVTRIISSDLSRAHDTAAIIGEHLGLEVEDDPRLRETFMGQWQGRSTQEIDAETPGSRARWVHDASFAPPGGESRIQVAQRAKPVIDEIMCSWEHWDQGSLLVVAHGGVIRALTGVLLELEPHQYPIFFAIGNTHRVELVARPRFDPHYVVPDKENDAAHPRAVFTPETVTDPQWYLSSWNRGHD